MKPIHQQSREILPDLHRCSILPITAGAFCPQCNQPGGPFYVDEDFPNGACLSCRIDAGQQERDEAYADETAWVEDICTCGID